MSRTPGCRTNLAVNRGTQNGPASRLGTAHHCNPCHPGGEGGLGPALKNKPLPEGAIRLQVRQGLGAMPAFSEEELPDGQLDDIVEYLRAIR